MRKDEILFSQAKMANVDMEVEKEDIFSHTIQILLNHEDKEPNHGNLLPPSIYMVPSVFRDLSPVSFNPRVVSIGPLHKENTNLQVYEGQKVAFLHGLLGRLDTPIEETLKTCLVKVNTSVERIRGCYAGMKIYTDVELNKMMVVDACFILELILRYLEFEDSIWRNLLLTRYLIYDLILIENQIPFFVLTDIFECTIMKFRPGTTLISLIYSVLNYVNLFEEDLNIDTIGENTTHDHILGILRKSYQPTHAIPLSLTRLKNRTALELERAGVNFKTNQHAMWPLAITVEISRFPSLSWCWGKPTLKMPLLRVNDFTEMVLRNLIAYEQCSGCPSYVTSYAAFMDMLVNTQEDVAKLVECDVVDNFLGSNEDAANMINKICNEVVIVDSVYFKQLELLDRYYNSYWPKNISRLRRKYFTSPWNFIALLAAIILFALTVIQTIFSIKAL
ncbi:putative UPF0481 protein [Tanacetum coccineum]